MNSHQKILFQGNAELLSISSDDSIWNSEDEEGDAEDRQSETGGPRSHWHGVKGGFYGR